MLRPILTIFQFWIGGKGASEAKRLAVVAAVLGGVALSGALTANAALAAAVFLALQPVMEPAWAPAFAAAATLLLATILIVGICWLAGGARRRGIRDATANNAAQAETAVLIGTLASAFLSGIVSGMDRRPSQPRGDQT